MAEPGQAGDEDGLELPAPGHPQAGQGALGRSHEQAGRRGEQRQRAPGDRDLHAPGLVGVARDLGGDRAGAPLRVEKVDLHGLPLAQGDLVLRAGRPEAAATSEVADAEAHAVHEPPGDALGDGLEEGGNAREVDVHATAPVSVHEGRTEHERGLAGEGGRVGGGHAAHTRDEGPVGVEGLDHAPLGLGHDGARLVAGRDTEHRAAEQGLPDDDVGDAGEVAEQAAGLALQVRGEEGTAARTASGVAGDDAPLAVEGHQGEAPGHDHPLGEGAEEAGEGAAGGPPTQGAQQGARQQLAERGVGVAGNPGVESIVGGCSRRIDRDGAQVGVQPAGELLLGGPWPGR